MCRREAEWSGRDLHVHMYTDLGCKKMLSEQDQPRGHQDSRQEQQSHVAEHDTRQAGRKPTLQSHETKRMGLVWCHGEEEKP